ncbi:MAG: response regulator [Mariprofundaceae bacterium]
MKTIAVIEPNSDTRLLLKGMLDGAFCLQEFDDTREAIGVMQQQPPDLLLLGISLPINEGLQMLAAIRKVTCLYGLPVVAVTAHAMAGDREYFLSAGFNGYVREPIVDEQYLFGVISRCMEIDDAAS